MLVSAILLRRFDLCVASTASAAWCALLLDAFTRNDATSDARLLALYLVVYAAFWLAVCWCARVAATLLLRRYTRPDAGRAIPASVAGLVAGAAVAATMAAQAARAPAPAHWVFIVVAALLAAGALWELIARRPLVAPGGGVARWTRRGALAAAPLLLLGYAAARLPAPWNRAPAIRVELASGVSPDRPTTRVRLLAADGFDLEHARRLIARGRLPNFKRVIEGGTSSRVTTISPHSPVVWTSIATGSAPAAHGVHDYTTTYVRGTSLTAPEHGLDFIGRFLEARIGYREIASVSSNDRRVKAMWEVFSQFGVRSLIVNWWATYPAEPIEGRLVSQHAIPWGLRRVDVDELEKLAHLSWPPELESEVTSITRDFIREKNGRRLTRKALEAAERRFPDKANPKNAFAFTKTGARFFSARDDLVLRLYEKLLQPDVRFAAVYLQGVDTNSHAFTEAVFGRNVNRVRSPRVSRPELDRRWRKLVVAGYESMDRNLGRILERMTPVDCLVIVSDHGWRYDGTSHWRMPDSTFIAYGDMVERGRELEDVHVYDILPTLAYLLGVPLSRELPGIALFDAFTTEYRSSNEPTRIQSYGPRGWRLSVTRTATDDAHLERLRSLGYMQEDSDR